MSKIEQTYFYASLICTKQVESQVLIFYDILRECTHFAHVSKSDEHAEKAYFAIRETHEPFVYPIKHIIVACDEIMKNQHN